MARALWFITPIRPARVNCSFTSLPMAQRSESRRTPRPTIAIRTAKPRHVEAFLGPGFSMECFSYHKKSWNANWPLPPAKISARSVAAGFSWSRRSPSSIPNPTTWKAKFTTGTTKKLGRYGWLRSFHRFSITSTGALFVDVFRFPFSIKLMLTIKRQILHLFKSLARRAGVKPSQK